MKNQGVILRTRGLGSRSRHSPASPGAPAAFRRLAALGLLGAALAAGGCASAEPEEFSSPDRAVHSLVAAVRDDSTDGLTSLFGDDMSDLISSGDDVDDRNMRTRFIELYDAGHRLEKTPDGATLLVGPEDWPFPVPLVRRDGQWSFDPQAGRDEIINRRVGRNELDTIEVCRAVVDAQREYAAMPVDGKPRGEFAQQFLSSEPTAADAGRPPHDGLYWPTAPGEPPSPLGELIAEAQEQGYSREGQTGKHPFHGYLYRMLTKQGPHAPGGAMDYVVNGRMTGGFAVLASPVEYGSSGVMTFLVGENGVVFQADLGEETESLALEMAAYDPDPQWTVCE